LSEGERRLAAIMFTDMVGYTALGQKNESLSLALVEEQRKLIRPILNRHDGREVKTMGDSFLVEFSSALNAVRCAYDIQRTAREYNISLPEQRRVHLRIGVHLGDVINFQGDISGDAVNVASRINHLADDGAVCLTRQVYDQVQNKFELPLKSLGPTSLKNVNTPVEVYRMEMPWDEKRGAQTAKLDKKRIAVLPFANMSPDPADEYFADGLTEELISKLSLMKGLRVIARTSVMNYKKKEKRISEIGTELGVGSIVEGSFRKAGNKIRVTTQLIDVMDEHHVWAQSYDRNIDDVFAVQTDIAKQVTDALKVKILDAEIDGIDRKPTESTKAYTLYLRGRHHFNRRGVEDIKNALEYFDQAVREDARFALGYVGLADCYEGLSSLRIDSAANRDKAKIAIAKGLELDGDLAEAHATRGLVLLDDFNLKEAESELRKAIELKPGYAPTHQRYFFLLLGELKWNEALREIEKALELDPFSQSINLSHALYYRSRRDYDKALELFKKAAELNPNFAQAHFELALTYGRMKRLDDMRREFGISIELGKREFEIASEFVHGSYQRRVKMLDAFTAYFEDDTEKVRKLLPELELFVQLGEPLAIYAFSIAGFYFYLGENERGFQWLEKSYSKREFPLLVNMRTNEMSWFDSIQSDPRYHDLLKRIGLE
jgi:adenylate cyclase